MNAKLGFLCCKPIKLTILEFDKSFWSERYENNLLGWDAGAITTPIKDYIDQLTDKDLAIFIPGCGMGHEAIYLHENGFSNVTVIDIVDAPLKALRSKCPKWPSERFIVGDFFDHQGAYDLIIEQTFFCALEPKLRQPYADKIAELLKPGGKLTGLLFDFPLTESGPPFGGSKGEYRQYFSVFSKLYIERAYNSIKPRKGAELFINIQK